MTSSVPSDAAIDRAALSLIPSLLVISERAYQDSIRPPVPSDAQPPRPTVGAGRATCHVCDAPLADHTLGGGHPGGAR